MNCDEYLPLLSGHLDGENSEPEEHRLQAHLRICGSCRALLAQMKQNDALLRSSAAMPPVDLTDRIMREVRKESKPKKSAKKRWIPALSSGLAVAALLALVFWGKLPVIEPSKDAMKTEADAKSETAPAEAPELSGRDDPDNQYSYMTEAQDANMQSPAATEDLVLTEGLIVTESPVVTDSHETRAGTGIKDTEGLSTDPNSPGNDGTVNIGTHMDLGSLGNKVSNLKAPTLIVWEAEDLNTLSDFEAEDLNELDLTAVKSDKTLYEYYQIIRSLLRKFDHFSSADIYRMKIFTVSYETMMATFNECADKFENSIYYPDEYTAQDDCIVVLVTHAE